MRKARILVAMVAAALTLPLLAQTSPTASDSPASLVPPVTPETPAQTSVPAPPLPTQGQPLTPDNVNAWLDAELIHHALDFQVLSALGAFEDRQIAGVRIAGPARRLRLLAE